MKKTIKITISVVAALILAVALTALILGFVKIRPMDKFFGDYERVDVFDFSQSESIPEVVNGNMREKLDDALSETSYSILNGIISGKTDSGLRANMTDGKARQFTAKEISELKATENSYMLRFDYGTRKRTLEKGKVSGVDEDIVYDKLYMFITEGPNEVVTVQVIPVDMDAVLNVSDDESDSEFYRAYDLRLNMYAVDLFNTVKEVIDEYKATK